VYPQPRVLAQAIVDPGAFEVADRVNLQAFLVTVRGHLETGDLLAPAVYEIAAENEDVAARAGLHRYVAEQSRVN